MVIDFHTHAFPAKIAEKAIDSLARKAGLMFPFYRGDEQCLVDHLQKSGVDRAVVLNIATNPRQQKNVNDYAISLQARSSLIPFGSVHPESEDWAEELERLKNAGIKGIKFHPEYQEFFVDEKRMLPIYEKIGELGLITVFHAGLDLGYEPPFRCTPERLSRILPAFGGAPVAAAHWGGITEVYDTLKYLCGTDIYLDTAFSYGTVAPAVAKRIIENHGADKILLGSDLPWESTAQSLAFLQCLHLSETDYRKIAGDNARKLLGI